MVHKFYYVVRTPQYDQKHVDVYNPGTEQWQSSLTRSCLVTGPEDCLDASCSRIVAVWIIISHERAKILAGLFAPGCTMTGVPEHLEEQIVMALTSAFAKHKQWQKLYRKWADRHKVHDELLAELEAHTG